jgi:hypothetical protein
MVQTRNQGLYQPGLYKNLEKVNRSIVFDKKAIQKKKSKPTQQVKQLVDTFNFHISKRLRPSIRFPMITIRIFISKTFYNYLVNEFNLKKSFSENENFFLSEKT